MSDIVHHTVDANGIKIHYAEAGAGPLKVVGHPCERKHRGDPLRTLASVEHHHMHERVRFPRRIRR